MFRIVNQDSNRFLLLKSVSTPSYQHCILVNSSRHGLSLHHPSQKKDKDNQSDRRPMTILYMHPGTDSLCVSDGVGSLRLHHTTHPKHTRRLTQATVTRHLKSFKLVSNEISLTAFALLSI